MARYKSDTSVAKKTYSYGLTIAGKFGVTLDAEQMPSSEARNRLGKEISKATENKNPHPYSREKAESVQACLDSLAIENRPVTFGYDVDGVRPPYGGLPTELFDDIDPPIAEIIDKLAKSAKVELTGQCCAGHVTRSGVDADEKVLFGVPYLMLLFRPDEEGNEIRTRLYHALQKVDVSIQTLEGRLRLCNGLHGTQLLGAEVGTERHLVLYMIPDLEKPAVEKHKDERARDYVDLLIRYWETVGSVLQKELGIEIGHRLKNEFFKS